MKTTVWLAVWVIVAASAQLHAQNMIGNGRALDNNLQVGTGRANPVGQQLNFNAGNNIITGNVSGLSRFHGRVGYGSPGEFRGNLPSNSLFKFQAQSSQGASGYSLIPQSIYRGGTGVSASDIANAGGNQLIIPRRHEAIDAYKTVLPSGAVTNRTSSIGATRQPDGSKLQISAGNKSDGKRIGDLRPRTLDLGAPIGGEASVARDNMTIIGVTDSQLVDDRLSSPGLFTPAAVDNAGIDTRVNTLSEQNATDRADHQLQSFKDRADQQNTAPSEIDDDQKAYSQIIDRTHKSQQASNPNGDLMMRPLVPMDAGPQHANQSNVSPFASVLSAEEKPQPATSAIDLQRQLQAQRQLIIESQLGKVSQADTTSQAPVAPSMPDAPKGHWLLPEHMKPIIKQTLPTESSADTDNPREPGKIATAADFSLPVAGSLTSATDRQADLLLREAEAQLANQRYFDADDTYLDVLRLRPDDHMASIGQIHAQIGVGMIRTASYKLRRLLLKHPELISTRYDKKLLPAAQRLRWVQEELTEMTTQSQSVEPPLLLAYLGFQLDKPRQIRSALDIAVERKPNDPVVLLLRRIWLKDRPATQ